MHSARLLADAQQVGLRLGARRRAGLVESPSIEGQLQTLAQAFAPTSLRRAYSHSDEF